VSYQQPPFDSRTVRRTPSRTRDTWIIAGTVAGVLAMLGIGAWAIVAITSSRATPPVAGGATTGTTRPAAPVDPMAAAAAQQFADALSDDDVAAAKLVVCASEHPTAAGAKVPYQVKKVTVAGSTGTVQLVKHPQPGQDADVPAVRLVKQDGDWKVCGAA
jgi:hypothetical protein